jgi:hypothetical protein
MKTTSLLYTVLAAAGMLCATTARASMAILQLERSTDLQHWQSVPVTPTLLTPAGGILQATNDPKAVYRLRIDSDQNAGFTAAMLLSDAPAFAVDIAQQFLRDTLLEDRESQGGNPEGNWQDAILGPVCYPVYDLAVGKGKSPAYIEFKVIRRPIPLPDPAPDEPFPIRPPLAFNSEGDFGRILIALTPADFPVVEFAQSGPTHVETLLRASRANGPIKPVRFDDGFLVAEDSAGAMVGSLGNEPFQMDPAILQIAGREFDGMADDSGQRQGESPQFPASPYKSYRDLRADFLENPLFAELRRLRAEMAKPEWDLIEGKEPASIQVSLDKAQQILPNQPIQSASVQDPSVAELGFKPGTPGLWITGTQVGGTLLEVVFTDGTRQTFVLLVTSGAAKSATLNLAMSGWTAWQYWYAGNWSDQRRYNQFWKDPQMCVNGWSGCGPTAWGMLYGWWDRKGSPRCLKNTALADSPLNNDSSVLDCNRYVFNAVGPFCVNGQAATMPWNMSDGYKWGLARGAGFSISWSWGVPYLSPGSRDRAIDSIKSGRPAIVGLGFYWHYPLAYGYAERKYKILGITVSTSQYFDCNMGWGGGSSQWQNASSTWFGTHGRYW